MPKKILTDVQVLEKKGKQLYELVSQGDIEGFSLDMFKEGNDHEI